MPVEKYRSVSAMPPPPGVRAEELSDRIRALWNRAFLLSPPHFVRGVARFRSIEESGAARQANTLARMRRSGAQRP